MNRLTLNPAPTSTGDDDKPPFFLPNRAAYRRVAKGVKSRQRKASKWAYRVEHSGGDPKLVDLFHHLAERATSDLEYLKGVRA